MPGLDSVYRVLCPRGTGPARHRWLGAESGLGKPQQQELRKVFVRELLVRGEGASRMQSLAKQAEQAAENKNCLRCIGFVGMGGNKINTC